MEISNWNNIKPIVRLETSYSLKVIRAKQLCNGGHVVMVRFCPKTKLFTQLMQLDSSDNILEK